MNSDKTKSKKIRIVLICVLCVVLLASLIGVIAVKVIEAKKSPVILECGDSVIRLDMYEFMLSRMKGTLYNNREDVKKDSYWDEVVADGKTREEYYNASILENCKVYLASAVLFDELVESGEIAGLPESYLRQIEEDIALYIDLDYVGAGSEEKFGEILGEYGVDVDGLREIYTLEAKSQYVREYIYGSDTASKISDEVKEEYYRENYYRFKHILVGNFYYKYQRDIFGNKIYFDGDGTTPLYDYENGEVRFGSDDNYITDANGIKAAFDKTTGEYLYDTENGSARFVNDENGTPKKFFYTEAELDGRKNVAEELLEIAKGDFDTFEAKGKDADVNTDYSGTFSESSGIYMSNIEASGYTEYMNEMLDELKDMEVGEISMVEADDGYHVFMKYELDAGAFSESANKEWFESFNSSLITKMFLEKCSAMFDKFEVNEENLKRARSIRDIGINTNY